MSKKKAATQKGGAEKRPEFVETQRYSEIEVLAEKEKAGWETTPIDQVETAPGDDPPPGDIPGEPAQKSTETPSPEGVSVSEGEKPPEGEPPAEKPEGEEPAPTMVPTDTPVEDFDTLVVDGVETKAEKAKIYET